VEVLDEVSVFSGSLLFCNFDLVILFHGVALERCLALLHVLKLPFEFLDGLRILLLVIHYVLLMLLHVLIIDLHETLQVLLLIFALDNSVDLVYETLYYFVFDLGLLLFPLHIPV